MSNDIAGTAGVAPGRFVRLDESVARSPVAHTRAGAFPRVLTLEAIHAAPSRCERGPERAGMKAMYLPEEQAFLRYIEIPGDGPPLLWLHGWQCSATGELMPAAVQPPLRSRRSLLIDFLGHGYSDKPLDFAYTCEAHARTIVALIDGLGLTECGIVGHSMGGAVAVLVAAARPAVVSLLVMAEASVDPDISISLSDQTEDRFVELGFAELLGGQAREAHEKPGGIRATHLEMTRLIEPRAIYREALSLERGTDPTVRSLLGGLRMPRWYLMGGLSDPEPELERDLGAMGVGWKVVPETGHAMGLQNPAGLGTAVAEAVVASWPG